MKIPVIFLIAFVLGLAVVAYTVFEPPGGPSRYIVIAGPDTQRMTDGEHVRTILFIACAVMTIVAVVAAFFRAKVAAVLWSIVLLVIVVRAFLPSLPTGSYPFATFVFWCGVVVQMGLCYSVFRLLKKTAEPCAPPNRGPAEPLSNSGISGGRPSVS